jgi:hypothetical protein
MLARSAGEQAPDRSGAAVLPSRLSAGIEAIAKTWFNRKPLRKTRNRQDRRINRPLRPLLLDAQSPGPVDWVGRRNNVRF